MFIRRCASMLVVIALFLTACSEEDVIPPTQAPESKAASSSASSSQAQPTTASKPAQAVARLFKQQCWRKEREGVDAQWLPFDPYKAVK